MIDDNNDGLEFDFVRKQIDVISEINKVFIKYNLNLLEGFSILNNIFISRLGITTVLTTEQKWNVFYRFFTYNFQSLRENTAENYDPVKLFKQVSQQIGEENTIEMIDKLNKSVRGQDVDNNDNNNNNKKQEN